MRCSSPAISPWSAAVCSAYRDSPEPVEDLMQVGYVGLLKAINNFDPACGSNLAAYAQPCISGEIKRHFRDKRWQVHVKRSAAGTAAGGPQATRRARPGARPRARRTTEMAEHLGVSAGRPAGRPAGRHGLPAALAGRAAGRRRRRRPPWPTCSARRTRRWSTRWTWRRSCAHWSELPDREQRILTHALLRQHDPGRDRRAARHLPDARLPAAAPARSVTCASACWGTRRRRRPTRLTAAERLMPGAPPGSGVAARNPGGVTSYRRRG